MYRVVLTARFVGVYSEEKVHRTIDAMKGRRDNLIQVSVKWNAREVE